MTVRGNATPVYNNNVNAEPDMFLDLKKGDLHLRETANKVIDQGIPLGSFVNDDIDGDERGLSPDIGADELSIINEQSVP